MKKFLLLTAIASVASVATVAPVIAQTTTGTTTVTTTALKSCTAPATANIGLPNYNGTAAVTATQNIVFKCTNTTPAQVTLLSTNNPAAATGKLKDGVGNLIDYSFTGDGTNVVGLGVTLVAATDLIVPLVANVAAGQNPVPNTYTDVINITVTY
jgi:spore coat protein U-like protein